MNTTRVINLPRSEDEYNGLPLIDATVAFLSTGNRRFCWMKLWSRNSRASMRLLANACRSDDVPPLAELELEVREFDYSLGLML